MHYALDPVGGDTGTQVFDSLAADGLLVVYGTLTNEPIRIDSRRMIAGKRIVRGFWLGHWMREQSIPKSLKLFGEIGRQIRAGVLATEVGGRYPLREVVAAAQAAEVPGKPGKILLMIGDA